MEKYGVDMVVGNLLGNKSWIKIRINRRYGGIQGEKGEKGDKGEKCEKDKENNMLEMEFN